MELIQFNPFLKSDWAFIYAARTIEVGEEIYNSYIDLTSSKEMRQSELKSQYGFDCDCSKCSKE